MKFSIDYTTRWHDTDACRRVRPSALLVYMQETSNRHVASTGVSLDRLRDEKGLAFILSKIRISFSQPLAAFEDITVETFTCPSRGYSSTRCFRILSGGNVIAEADSTWALVDINDRSLKTMDAAGYSFEDEAALELELPMRTRMPKDAIPQVVGERKIVYSDLDYNMHMNNTRYPDMLCDFLPFDKTGSVKGMTLSYIREAAFGDILTVERAEKDGVYYFRTVNQRGEVCLEAVVCMG